MDGGRVEQSVGRVLSGLGKFTFGAIFKPKSDALLHLGEEVGLADERIDLGVVEVVHPDVGVADEQFLVGLRHYDGGSVANGRGLDPKLVAESSILHGRDEVHKRAVHLLGPDPCFDGTWYSTLNFAQLVFI
jgi:hypothetical protein